MRALSFKAALSLVSTLGLVSTAHAGMHESSYSVELNKTQVVRLSEPAAAIVVGNPMIADVSVHSSDTIFVLGRGYGETNIIILNSAGGTVMDANVQVTTVLPQSGVRLYKGATDRNTYNCAPYCQPAPILGDEPGFIGANSGRGERINNQVANGAAISADVTPSGMPSVASAPPGGFAPN